VITVERLSGTCEALSFILSSTGMRGKKRTEKGNRRRRKKKKRKRK
jgi:hypothetical protein